MSGKTFDDTALEFMKIYFTCNPEKLPKEADKAFVEMQKIFSSYKEKLIEKGIKKNTDFFSDKF